MEAPSFDKKRSQRSCETTPQSADNNPPTIKENPSKMAEEISCPICLASLDDEDTENLTPTFVITPCRHSFCMPCVERALKSQTQQPRVQQRYDHDDEEFNHLQNPTKWKCPMCRQVTSLFDFRHAANSTETLSSSSSDSLVYPKNTILSSWPIANFVYKQEAFKRISRNADGLLQSVIDDKGGIKGFGITFRFQDDVPSLDFVKPLTVAPVDGWNKVRNDENYDAATLESINFDSFFFFEQTMTFHGKMRFGAPVSNHRPKYVYGELDVLLQFTDNMSCIRNGYLRWKIQPTQNYPLDGIWSVNWQSGNTIQIKVQNHFFECFGESYQIELDENHRPWFYWPTDLANGEEPFKQTSNLQIVPGVYVPGVGDVVEWSSYHETIIWERIATAADLGYEFVNLRPTSFSSYQKVNNRQDDDDQPLIPSYRNNTLWGNTFCQALCIGLASYHFLEPDADGVYNAYISYEHPLTSQWPNLDNGMAVPSQVPFRNIRWNSETRTFSGDISWLQDYGTTWNGESEWSYEIKFDPAFMFISTGTCTRSEEEPNEFGRDLIYVNAALEQAMREMPGGFDTAMFLMQCQMGNASHDTLQMMEEVANALEYNHEGSIFDFNI